MAEQDDDKAARRRRRRRRRKNRPVENERKPRNPRPVQNERNPRNPNPPSESKPARDKEPKDPKLNFKNPTTYDMFEEFPEVDESNADAVADFVDNIRRNLQSRSGELIARYTIKEVDIIPKDFARITRYQDDDYVPDFDDIISQQVSEDQRSRLSPAMIPEDDFVEGVNYVFGSSTEQGFIEGVPNYNDDGSVLWDVKITIPDTIGVSDYLVQYNVGEA